MWRFSDLFVPFLTVPPPAWPGPCRCCWSRFEGLGLFPSNRPAACPYPSAVPADFRSTRRVTWDRVISQKRQWFGSWQSQQDPWQQGKVNRDHDCSRPGLILHTACWAVSLFLRLTSRRRTRGGIASVVFSSFFFNQYGVKKTHTGTQRHKHGHKTLPAVANKTLADAAEVGRRAMKLKRSTN